MQQLQNTYGGDRSDTLAQILGLDYDPQGAMAAMAQQMLSTGMGSSTALKTRAMQDSTALNQLFLGRQYAMNDARRIRQETLSDKMMGRDWALEDAATARQNALFDMGQRRGYEVEDRNIRRQDLFTDRDMAKLDKDTREADELHGAVQGALANIDIFITQLEGVNDPEAAKEMEILKKQRQYLLDNVLNGTGSVAERKARIMAVGRTGQLEPQQIVRFKTLLDEAERKRKEAEEKAKKAAEAAAPPAASPTPTEAARRPNIRLSPR